MFDFLHKYQQHTMRTQTQRNRIEYRRVSYSDPTCGFA